MSPLVLAVPVLNAAEFLPATLQSINDQGPHARWWLQDSCSTDDTLRIADRFARPCDTIVSERDTGQSDAINRAFGKMGGDIIGFCAAFLTTASFIPQAWLTFKTRDVSGISLGMYSAFTLGVALWLVYGLTLGAWPVVVANTITLMLALSILVMKLRYGRPSTR